MINPIFIIRYPTNWFDGDKIDINSMNKLMADKFLEYYTLALPTSNDDWSFEMFNAKDITPFEFEELKKHVFDAVKELELK